MGGRNGGSCDAPRRGHGWSTGDAGSSRSKGRKMGRTARQLTRCKRRLGLGMCMALLAASLPLGAQSDDENARIHYESGAAYLKQSDNENALREFQAAYTLSKRPE